MNVVSLLLLASPAVLGSPVLDDVLPTKPVKGEEVAVMDTSEGRIVLMFYPKAAPKHVANFKSLAKRKFYDGTRFHRTISGFMIQGGDPLSKDIERSRQWGKGGNVVDGREVNVPAEFNDINHVRGVLSMARSPDGFNTASSQFFIMHAAAPHLDGKYSAFGRVVEGLDVVDKIAGTTTNDQNGGVVPGSAVVVKSVRIAKWPLKDDRMRWWNLIGWKGGGRGPSC